jgi:hypothetical protein
VYFTFAFSIRIVISPTVPYSEATEPRVPVGLDEAITSNVLLLRNIYATNDLMYVPLHKKLKIEQHKPGQKPGVNAVVLEC